EQAGFRPCQRCNPHQYPSQDSQIEMVRRACQYISASSEGVPRLDEVAGDLKVSPSHLRRVFKRATGVSPRQYADACRLGAFKEALHDGRSVTDAIYSAGYGSSSRLYEKAASQLGMTPASYRRGGKGMRIRYAVGDCSLGKLLVAATERGICAVSLGDDEDVLEDVLEVALRREYHEAEIERGDESLDAWLDAVLQLASGRRPHVELPLDVQATAFERLVWEELCRIPYGETRSYSEIARAIGKPTAARAVARACGANPAAMVIPCHRAVRQDGGAGGYRWGLERKQALLNQEQTPVR
ncbi:MAG: methylated-DNA--[protein]-cysteine S-methyltransferase, partial [Chloroflexi bacterium]|nr:methylated-DNA--[protein]-cysteine S-methyltransferase [Chloroflexota bacterium]